MQQVSDGGQDIRRPNLRFNHVASFDITRLRRQFQGYFYWHLYDEWDVGGGVVEKNSMRIFVVLAQALAMISDHDDQGIVVAASFLQVRNKVGQRRIGVSDF